MYHAEPLGPMHRLHHHLHDYCPAQCSSERGIVVKETYMGQLAEKHHLDIIITISLRSGELDAPRIILNITLLVGKWCLENITMNPVAAV